MATFHGIELISSEDLFRPTTISEHCAKNVDFQNKSILDLGCGIGPLAIYFALNGAKDVAACDIHPEHVKLAQKNAEKNQKWPLINLIRQILKQYNYELKPKRHADGYTKDGQKKYKRLFEIKRRKINVK